jgi:ATP-binding cassette subfamily F protein 3
VGNYDTYKHWLKEGLAVADRGAVGQAAKDKVAVKDKTSTSTKPSTDSNAAGSGSKRKRKYPYRKVSQIEQDITQTESRIEEIHNDMMQPEVLRDGRRVKQLQEELASLEAQLLQLYEHYEEACELN